MFRLTKPFVIMLALTFGGFAALTTFSVFTAEETIIESEVELLTAVADAHASQLSRMLHLYGENVNLVKSRTKLRRLVAAGRFGEHDGDRRFARRILADALASSDSFVSLTVVDTAGNRVTAAEHGAAERAANSPSLPPADVLPEGRAPRFEAWLADGSVDLLGRAQLHLDGAAIGWLFADIKLTAIADEIGRGGFGGTGEVVLGMRDAEGHARFVTGIRQMSEAAARTLATSKGHGTPMIHALNGENVVLRDGAADYDGTPVIAVTRHIPELGWGLVAKIDRAEVLGRIATIKYVLIAFGGFLALAATASIWMVGRRLQAELDQRKRAEARFSRIFTDAPNAMLLVARDGMIKLANQQAKDLLGYGGERLLEMSVDDLVPDHVRPRHPELRRSVEGEHSGVRAIGANRDVHAIDAEGRAVPVEIALMPIDTDEGPMMLAALVDLSERLETQRQLEAHAEDLERSNRELDEFAYVASHDLKAPLRGIDQLAGFIEEDAGHLLPDESRSDLTLLRGRITRLERLLADLLEYSRIGRMEDRREDVDANEAIEMLADLYVPNDRFTIVVEGDLPAIHASRAAVELVFRNLLMNAVKHHDGDRGEITVRGGREGGVLRFEVSDDGPGIPPGYEDKIFQLFETLKSRDKVEGSGMGLALVRKMIEFEGGSIELLRREGRGATFRLDWPDHQADAARAA